jgi:hypothetical protein
MANKRIYELGEQQNAYAPDLVMEIDDPNGNFTESKKVPMSVIYKLINELTDASGVNTSAYVIRLNNGSGTEVKMTLDNFLALWQDSIVEKTLYAPEGTNILELTVRKFGKMVVGQAKVLNEQDGNPPLKTVHEDSSGSNPYILPDAFKPKYDQVFYTDIQSDERNYLAFYTDGSVESMVDRNDASFENFPIAYIIE